MSIRPTDFASEQPPVRTIGTECEYNQQLPPDSDVTYVNFLDNELLHRKGINIQNNYLGEAHGAGKVYPDVGHLEFDTRESMGPASAAVQDIAGITHLSNIVAATGLPHNGVYGLSGTYIQNGLIENGTRVSTGRSSGYHESYLFPRYLEHDEFFRFLMPSLLAYQIWGRGGTLRADGFVYSQKIWGCGDAPIEHSLARRTAHGQKPMITIPQPGHDADTIGLDEWARAEVRMADPGLSLVNRYLNFANFSLGLRVIEQQQRLELAAEQMAKLCLTDPVAAAKTYAADLSLQKVAPTFNGTNVTALDGQEALLDVYETLAVMVELPEDERIAIGGIRSLVDALRASDPAVGTYTGMALLRDEFAPKHQFISNGKPQAEVNAGSTVAMHRNIEWSRVLPEGPGKNYWAKVETRDPLAAKVRELAAAAGVSKRSAQRAAMVDNPVSNRQVVNWSYYCDEAGKYRLIGSPAGD